MTLTNILPSKFKPSYLDQIIERIDRLSMPYWVFYFLLFFAVGFVFIVAGWLQGLLEIGVFPLSYFVLGIWIAENLFINHFLISSSVASLSEFKSQISITSSDFEKLKYSISHIPRFQSNLWIVFGMLNGIVTIINMINRQVSISDKFPIIYLGIGASIGSGFFFAAVYRTVRQLRSINQLFDSIEKVNLHALGPIYGLALLPAKFFFMVILVLYVNPVFFMLPEMLTDPLIMLIWGLLTLSSFGIAVLPLRGINRKLREEKERLLIENGSRLDLATTALYSQVDKGEHQNLDKLERGINALLALRNDIEAISTWPWNKDTIRWLATALLLPLGLLVIQFLLQRLFVS